MPEAAAILDRDEQMLCRLAELELAAAEKVHAKLMATEETAEVSELARSYQRLARSLRQTLALKARLKRERVQAEAKRRPEDDPRVPARKAEVREALARVVWTEYEREDAEDALEESEWYVDVASHEDRFLTDPIPVIVARLCQQLEIPLPPIPPPPGEVSAQPTEGVRSEAEAAPPDPPSSA
jgi:hypothetical protein